MRGRRGEEGWDGGKLEWGRIGRREAGRGWGCDSTGRSDGAEGPKLGRKAQSETTPMGGRKLPFLGHGSGNA